MKIFGPVYGFAPVLENLTEEEGRKFFGDEWQPLPLSQEPQEPAAPLASPSVAQEPQAPSEESPAAPAPTSPRPLPAAPAPLPGPRLERGAVYEYALRDLGVGVADRLARTIVQCQGRGSHPLRVVGPGGEAVLWPGASIMVNPIEFETVANLYGI